MDKVEKKSGAMGVLLRLRDLWRSNPLFSTGIALIVMVIVQTVALSMNTSFSSMGEWFQNWLQNWISLLRGNAGIGIIALGMTFVIISGGIDLSVGSVYVTVGAFIMVLLNTGESGWLAGMGLGGVPAILLGLVLALALGSLLGEGNGLLISYGRMPPFIATLGSMQILRSVTQYFMKTQKTELPEAYKSIARLSIGGQQLMPIIYWAVLAAAMYIISKKTTFGRYVFAIGSNERTTRLSGVNVRKVKRRVYALTGFLVGVAAIIQTSRIGSMDYASAGSGFEMDAIASVIVGGTSMSGGRGSVVGTVFGTLIVAVMNNLLNLIGVDPYLSAAFKGAIIIGAVLLQRKEKN
ncbi:ABC transporter permease [Acutalibacter sp. 1XD8-33]|uniref:ABC transporter permease n=1 Tax=Acutalibacter sp. 1XD8-33 TaxID=2320081 RepID=UPI0018F734A7|nr:ABC transporter permease [Acutalibacter sp. 1XD8-33]